MIPLDSWVASALTDSMLVAIPVAVLAGLVSFASPCVLPLLPGYLSYASGVGASQLVAGRGRRGPLVLGTIGFVLGFSLVFVATGAVAGGVGALLVQQQRTITIVAGILIIVLGVAFSGLLPLPSLWQPSYTPRAGVLASPLLGIVFGLGFTPCIGPALSVVLSLAFSEGSAGRGALLAFCYALGLGMPFVVFAFAFSALAPKLTWLRTHQAGLQRAGGALMVLVGLLMLTGGWDWLMGALRQWASSFGAVL